VYHRIEMHHRIEMYHQIETKYYVFLIWMKLNIMFYKNRTTHREKRSSMITVTYR